MQDPKILSRDETLKRLKISRATLYSMIERGVIRPVEKPSYLQRRYRLEFTEQEVNRVLRGEPVKDVA